MRRSKGVRRSVRRMSKKVVRRTKRNNTMRNQRRVNRRSSKKRVSRRRDNKRKKGNKRSSSRKVTKQYGGNLTDTYNKEHSGIHSAKKLLAEMQGDSPVIVFGARGLSVDSSSAHYFSWNYQLWDTITGNESEIEEYMGRFHGVELVQQNKITRNWKKVSHYSKTRGGTILEDDQTSIFAFLLNLGFTPAQVIEIQKNEDFKNLLNSPNPPTAQQICKVTGIQKRP